MVSTPPRSRSVPPPNPRPSPPTWNSFDPLLPSLPVMPTTPTKDVHYNPSFSPALDSSSCPLPPNSARRKSAPIPQLEHSPYQGRSLTHARSDSAATGPEPAVLKRARTCESLNTICNGGVIAESRRTTPVAASYGESVSHFRSRQCWQGRALGLTVSRTLHQGPPISASSSLDPLALPCSKLRRSYA